ncbi:MAG: EamA family transporter [Elusimicrobia bacterium]|nr:EamA family transporter [Elusimicrobiota bacterium]
MIATTIVLVLSVVCSAYGNVLTRRGMTELGPLADFRPRHLLRYGLAAVRNGRVLGGVAVNFGQFLAWLVVLSWAELSWALPMNALEYIVVALLAWKLLGERVAPRRWAGIGLISAGVFLVMLSWRGP